MPAIELPLLDGWWCRGADAALGSSPTRVGGAGVSGPEEDEIAVLARRVVESEIQGRTSPDALAAAIEGMFQRLHDLLAPLVGETGFRVVLDRALHGGPGECSWLAASAMVLGPKVIITALVQAVEREGRDRVVSCVEQLLVRSLSTIARFIGNELTLRLVRRAWADLPGPSPRGSHEEPTS